jgi:hypothetical protein
MSSSKKTAPWDGFKWEDRIMRWFSSKKTASWDGFSCLQVRRQNHEMLKAISWFCLLTWRHEKPSHDSVLLLEDMKNHLMILSSYCKKTASWDGFSCLQVRRQHHEMAFHVFKWEDRIMRWFSNKKIESWDGFSCLQVRRQNHEMVFHVLLEDMKNHLMMLSSYLKTWKTISWCCLLTWRH